MDNFTIKEILEATGGKLIWGNPDVCVGGVSIDSRTIKKGEIFIAIKGERFDGHDYINEALKKGASCIIAGRNKAVPLQNDLPCNFIAVEDANAALSGMAYYHRKRFNIPVIAVTGSNGKTTTKEMLVSLLASKYRVAKNEGTQNNLIGVSLNLLKLRSSHEIAVFELGTNHFGEIAQLSRLLAPQVGIITNVGPAHLEFFKDIRGVLEEKWSLIEELSWPRIAILNVDDPVLREKAADNSRDVTIFTFGIEQRADFVARKITLGKKSLNFFLKNFPLTLNTVARHNIYNAQAAYAAARLFSIDAYDIINVLKRFKMPSSRFEVKKINGFNVIDDAYNANPVSFHCAIEAFSRISAKGKKIAVIGDMLELGKEKEDYHRQLGQLLGKADLDMIIALGSMSHIACDCAKSCGFNPEAVHKCFSAKEARDILFSKAGKNDVILLKGSRGMRLEEILNIV